MLLMKNNLCSGIGIDLTVPTSRVTYKLIAKSVSFIFSINGKLIALAELLTRKRHNVVTASLQRQDVVATLYRS